MQQTEYNFVRDRYFDYWSKGGDQFRRALHSECDDGLGPQSARRPVADLR